MAAGHHTMRDIYMYKTPDTTTSTRDEVVASDSVWHIGSAASPLPSKVQLTYTMPTRTRRATCPYTEGPPARAHKWVPAGMPTASAGLASRPVLPSARPAAASAEPATAATALSEGCGVLAAVLSAVVPAVFG